jgi:hypothetical protein
VLTLILPRERGPRLASHAGAAFALAASISIAAISTGPAQAQEIEGGGCVGSWNTLNCVTRWAPYGDPYIRIVPPAADARAQALSKAREQRWVARCRPVIRQDRYGVFRYHYAMQGCGFGIGEY